MPIFLLAALTLAADPSADSAPRAVRPPLMAPPASPERIRQAIDGGVGFLVGEGKLWRDARGCAGCHHTPQMILGLVEARRAGYAVDGGLLTETISWSLASDNRARLLDPFNNPKWEGLNAGSVFIAIAAGMVELDAASKEGLVVHMKHILSQQRPDGSWANLDNARPPLGDLPDALTRYVLWALAHPAAEEILGAEPLAESKKRAQAFLAAHPPTTQQSLALALLLGPAPAAPAEEPLQQRDALFALQRPDGGFAQAPEMDSDAFATGQSLMALRRVGVVQEDPRLERAVSFLVNTQLPDGSWPMLSRPTLQGKPPAKLVGPITFTSAGWAVAGLAAARPKLELQTTQK